MYQDCPTIRGRKHISHLVKLSRKGYKTVTIFIAGFPSATEFKHYTGGDPLIKDALIKAINSM